MKAKVVKTNWKRTRNQMADTVASFDKQLIDLDCDIHSSAWPDRFASLIHESTESCDKKLKPIRVLSLFAGAGGLDIGFRDAGFEIVESVELEKKFCQTLKDNSGPGKYFPSAHVNCIDIKDFEPQDHDIDFIIGGPPCQTFSAAGRRANGVLGTTDARGVLFREYVRILAELKPVGFLFENVYGIVGAQGGKPWEAIKKSFSEIGYHLFYRVLDAADYGVPQHRERLFIVGLKEGEFHFPRPLFGVDSIGKVPFYNSATAIAGANLEGEELPQHIGGRYGYLIDEIPPGLNYSYYTEEMGHPRPVFAWRSKFSDFMYKADPAQPVRTIKAQGGQYTGPFHWDGRHFSLAEYKRLQTFPDSYAVLGNRGTVIQQLGNSVPPQLARILALSIREQVFNRKIPVSFDYLDHDAVLSFRKEKAKQTKSYREKAANALATQKEKSRSSFGTGAYSVDISENFEFIRHDSKTEGHYDVRCYEEGKDVYFELQEAATTNAQNDVEYKLRIMPVQEWQLSYKNIYGVARGQTRLVLTALWKSIENAIAESGGVADLVQLSGYYQYAPKVAIEMECTNSSVLDRAICMTASGCCTRHLVTTEELASLWDTTNKDVRSCAKEMRQVGFEIRNSNTNSQIPKETWLVPYEFPTLSPMSIQLRKQV